MSSATALRDHRRRLAGARAAGGKSRNKIQMNVLSPRAMGKQNFVCLPDESDASLIDVCLPMCVDDVYMHPSAASFHVD